MCEGQLFSLGNYQRDAWLVRDSSVVPISVNASSRKHPVFVIVFMSGRSEDDPNSVPAKEIHRSLSGPWHRVRPLSHVREEAHSKVAKGVLARVSVA